MLKKVNYLINHLKAAGIPWKITPYRAISFEEETCQSFDSWER